MCRRGNGVQFSLGPRHSTLNHLPPPSICFTHTKLESLITHPRKSVVPIIALTAFSTMKCVAITPIPEVFGAVIEYGVLSSTDQQGLRLLPPEHAPALPYSLMCNFVLRQSCRSRTAMADVCDTSDFQPILVRLSRDKNIDRMQSLTDLFDPLQRFRCILEFSLSSRFGEILTFLPNIRMHLFLPPFVLRLTTVFGLAY